MTTYASFVSTLAAVSITGVAAAGRLTAPPLSVPTLPCSFPSLPRGEQSPVVFTGGEHWATITVDLVVLIDAVGQSTLAANYAASLTMMDAVHEALAAADLGRTHPSYSLRVDMYPIGDQNYWAVIATVEGRG